MARQYQITAEIKKGWQEWGSLKLITKSKMTEAELIKTYGALRRITIRGHFDDIYIKL